MILPEAPLFSQTLSTPSRDSKFLTPFIHNYHFLTKENSWNDTDSTKPQDFLVGIFPIHKILLYRQRFRKLVKMGQSDGDIRPSENSNVPFEFFNGLNQQLKQLENYGIPAGLVQYTDRIIHGGGGELMKQKPTELIEEDIFERLYSAMSNKSLIGVAFSDSRNQSQYSQKNKTKKNRG